MSLALSYNFDSVFANVALLVVIFVVLYQILKMQFHAELVLFRWRHFVIYFIQGFALAFLFFIIFPQIIGIHLPLWNIEKDKKWDFPMSWNKLSRGEPSDRVLERIRINSDSFQGYLFLHYMKRVDQQNWVKDEIVKNEIIIDESAIEPSFTKSTEVELLSSNGDEPLNLKIYEKPIASGDLDIKGIQAIKNPAQNSLKSEWEYEKILSGFSKNQNWSEDLKRLQFLFSHFEYTYSPEPVKSIRDFFFQQRKGYCSHFAIAAAQILQDLGYKTRVVTGFVNPDYNTWGDYYIVRESHAHAWVEVLVGESPKAFDPTLWVPKPVLNSPNSFFTTLDYLEFKWDQLINKLSEPLTATVFLLVFIGLAVLIYFWRSSNKNLSPRQRAFFAYQKFILDLQKKTFAVSLDQGPKNNFMVLKKYTDNSDVFSKFFDNYLVFLYGKSQKANSLENYPFELEFKNWITRIEILRTTNASN
jgi:hypothetical protein